MSIRFSSPFTTLFTGLMDDPSETPDVVQEVFLKVFRNIGSFRGNSSLKTWIYRISFNEAYNHRRWFTRHKKQEVGLEKDDDESLSYQDVLPDPGRSAFDLVSDIETHALIEEALTGLNPAFRAAVVLAGYRGSQLRGDRGSFAGFARHCEVPHFARTRSTEEGVSEPAPAGTGSAVYARAGQVNG